MHSEVPLEILGVGFRKACPFDDAGVVDQDVDASEPLDRRIDERLGAGSRGHVTGVGDRSSAGSDDLSGDAGSRSGIRPLPFYRAAEVVDDDTRSALAEQQRIGAADPASRPGDDSDAPVEVKLGQAATLVSNPSSRASVPPTMAARSSAGTPTNSFSSSSRLPRNVPSACG